LEPGPDLTVLPANVDFAASDRRHLVAVDAETGQPCALVVLPSLVARWRGAWLVGIAFVAAWGAWFGVDFVELLSSAPGLRALVIAIVALSAVMGTRLVGLFAPALLVRDPGGSRCLLQLRQRPDWRLLGFRFAVFDGAAGRLGDVECLFGDWRARDRTGAERFHAADGELRWAVPFVTSTQREEPLEFEPWPGTTPVAEDSALLFAAQVAAHVAFLRRL
jgi:hypothetical protein